MSKIAIVAGGSGLVGHELMMLLLKEDAISQVHSLGRRPINLSHSKLKEHIHVDLAITKWDDKTPSPELGFICLGTTLKQAGSKKARTNRCRSCLQCRSRNEARRCKEISRGVQLWRRS